MHLFPLSEGSCPPESCLRAVEGHGSTKAKLG